VQQDFAIEETRPGFASALVDQRADTTVLDGPLPAAYLVGRGDRLDAHHPCIEFHVTLLIGLEKLFRASAMATG